MNNKNFNNKLKEMKITQYKLAKISGVPYTTINELVNNKADINKCTAETVQKIAVSLETEVSKILNPISYMNGITGKYRKLKYKWEKQPSGEMALIFNDGDKTVIIDADGTYETTAAKKYADLCAEIEIDKYLKRKAFEAECDRLMEKMHEI